MKIYQSESSALCNAHCSYCPQKLMTRPQGNMNLKTFKQVLKVMDNNYFALHHFGEPLINPLLPEFIRLANEAGKKVEFSTNGSNLTQLTKAILNHPYMVRLAVDPFKADNIVKTYKTMCSLENVKFEAHSVNKKTKPFINFAGQVEGKSEVKGICYFKLYKYVVVLWDGRVVPCCCDYDAKEVIGNIWDGVNPKKTYELCKNCGGLQFASEGLWEKEI